MNQPLRRVFFAGLALCACALTLPAFAGTADAQAPPPLIEVAIAALERVAPFVLSLLLLVLPFAVGAVRGMLSTQDREKLLAATKGAALVVGEIAKHTRTTLDDGLAQVLSGVAAELGKPLTPKQVVKVRSIALALHSDERFPARIATTSPDPDALRAALSHQPQARA